ncbi:glycosyltransferase family 2 protein [Olleya namhaensis]|uniref:glycosyltransferase family 2 protein n=1 Tax=Olleya namhaensis TaxID=1144750 RepID=UPI002493ACE1|nr:glycosyltransferase family 2 protein [Olleya namhaensis]
MKISIITATYNSGATISSCMASVLQQTYPNIEYVIIDGQSKDNTLEVVQALKTKHPQANIVVQSEADKGIYDALNKGVALASGDVIGFVHSDDVLATTNTIKNIVAGLSYPNVSGVYGDLQYVTKEDTDKVVRHWQSQDFKPSFLKKGWMPAHPTLYLKREVYAKHGGFNLDYKIAADYDFILRVFKDKNYTFKYLPEVIMKMRTGGASNRSLKNIIIKSKEDYKAVTSNNVGGLWSIFYKNVSKVNQFFKS